METTKTMRSQFAIDVKQGLGKERKSLPSKYFYDEEGDRIFQQIMEMPEYYLTRSEFEIFSQQRDEICQAMGAFEEPFNLIEFGAGDGTKTKLLLRRFLEGHADFTYFPVDISQNILEELSANLEKEFPNLKVHTLNTDYFGALEQMTRFDDRRNITLFLGSNIGNFHLNEAEGFVKKLASNFKTGDLFLLGADLKKDPEIIINAYNDPHGITASFNLNLLRRMNRELGADFHLDNFKHYTLYEPETGEVLSYLVSLKEQRVNFSDLQWKVRFNKDEFIHTEVSKKYSLAELEHLANGQGFEVIEHFLDDHEYFTDTLWKKKDRSS